MRKTRCGKMLPLQSRIGLLMLAAYLLTQQFVGEIPDPIAYPVMIVSCVLMLVGVYKQGCALGKQKKQS